MAYDNPIPGFQTNNTINLRLWAAKPDREFDLEAFNTGDYVQVGLCAVALIVILLYGRGSQGPRDSKCTVFAEATSQAAGTLSKECHLIQLAWVICCMKMLCATAQQHSLLSTFLSLGDCQLILLRHAC